MRRLFPFSFLALLLLSGCNSVTMDSLKPSQEKLKSTLRSYEVTVRWGNIADAYKHLTPELQELAKIPSSLENIKVTHYEVLSPLQMKDDKALQQVRIRYIHQDRQVMRTLIDQQQWIELPEQGWRRANPMPQFR